MFSPAANIHNRLFKFEFSVGKSGGKFFKTRPDFFILINLTGKT